MSRRSTTSSPLTTGRLHPGRSAAALEKETRGVSELDEAQTDPRVFSTIAREYPPIVRDYEVAFDRQPSRLVMTDLAQVGDDGTRQFIAERLGDERFRTVRRQMRVMVKRWSTERIDPPAAPPARLGAFQGGTQAANPELN